MWERLAIMLAAVIISMAGGTFPPPIREGATNVKWRNAADDTCADCVSKPHFPMICAFCSRSRPAVRPWCGPPGSAGSARVCGRGDGQVVCRHLLIGPETDQFFSTEHLRWDVAAECTPGGQRPADDEQSGKDLIVIIDIAGRPAGEPHSRKCAGPPFAGHAGDSNVVQRAPPRRGEQGGPPPGPVASDRNSGPRDGGRSSIFQPYL